LGGAFFGFHNVWYAERSWEESERILNYIYDLGHNPQSLVRMVVGHLSNRFRDITEEITHLENCIKWALARCEFPNELYHGQTCYDQYLEVDYNKYEEDTQYRIKALDEKFLAHGALTGEQLYEIESKSINELPDPYDYRLIAEILK
jgi:hypothetical protein